MAFYNSRNRKLDTRCVGFKTLTKEYTSWGVAIRGRCSLTSDPPLDLSNSCPSFLSNTKDQFQDAFRRQDLCIHTTLYTPDIHTQGRLKRKKERKPGSVDLTMPSSPHLGRDRKFPTLDGPKGDDFNSRPNNFNFIYIIFCNFGDLKFSFLLVEHHLLFKPYLVFLSVTQVPGT